MYNLWKQLSQVQWKYSVRFRSDYRYQQQMISEYRGENCDYAKTCIFPSSASRLSDDREQRKTSSTKAVGS